MYTSVYEYNYEIEGHAYLSTDSGIWHVTLMWFLSLPVLQYPVDCYLMQNRCMKLMVRINLLILFNNSSLIIRVTIWIYIMIDLFENKVEETVTQFA